MNDVIAAPLASSPPLVRPWQSELLSSIPGVAYGLTRRVPGLGLADGNIGFSQPRDRDDAWAMRRHWCAALDLDPEHLVTLGQVHGRNVRIAATTDAGRGARPGSTPIGLGDALVTDQIGPVLMTLHADCQPVLVVDPGAGRRGPAVGVAHAGWRGTVADIVGAMIAVMTTAFGTRADDVHVVLGPAIGRCCYDVGEDVVSAWRQTAGSDAGAALESDSQRHWFSLTAANTLLLTRAHVPAVNIEASDICTRCNGDKWFSHRGQGAQTGRFGALIAIDGG